MPASASGVSTQRSAPKRSRSPAVARKTPPARPTSSPSTSTFCVALHLDVQRVVDRLDEVAAQLTEDPPQLGEVVRERRGRVGERVLEDEADVGGRLGLGGGDPGAHRVGRLGLDLLVERVVEDPLPAEVAREAADALVRALLLDPLEVDVRLRVVGGRVRRGAVGHRLDEASAPRRRGRARPLRAPPRRRRARRRRRRGLPGSRSRRPCRRAPRPASAPRAASRSPTGCCCRGGRAARASPRRSSRPRGTRPPRWRRRRRRSARRRVSPRSRLPQASPAACGTWVAIGTQIEARL